LYAHRNDAVDHSRFRAWLDSVVKGPTRYGIAEIVLSGFVRIVTNSRIYDPPTSLDHALEFCEFVREGQSAVIVAPGPRHWQTFARLCVASGAKAGLVADAYLAALAIESDCELITTDRDFAKFPGLRWRHPF
jgi:toxin-antitoxin system PIN domain toxin